MCSFRKNPYPPHGRSSEIPWGGGGGGGGGVLKEFPRGGGGGGRGGWGVQKQNPSVRSVWILSGTEQYTEQV